jgi:putative addiction module component (TIGR02574 family)
MASPDEALSDLLQRPPEERARAARTLLESLDDGDDDMTAIEEQTSEILRRMQALEEGRVTLVDYAEVRQRVLARLRSLRAQ